MPKEEENKTPPDFTLEKELSKDELKDFKSAKKRIEVLKKTRDDVFGLNLDEIWAEADRKYVPHRVKGTGKKVIATDETKGWRGSLVELENPKAWRSDISKANPFVKIQTALAILIDRNPTAVFKPSSKEYEAITPLPKQLYHDNWRVAKSKQQLRLFVFNLAKYGWACARTYPKKIERNGAVVFNDVFRENLDPFNVWMDDMAKPNDPHSIRDWCWRRIYDMDEAEEMYGEYPNWKFVKEGGVMKDNLSTGTEKKFDTKNKVEAYFYESLNLNGNDRFIGIFNEVPVVIEELPIEDINGAKRLSLWQTYWLLRHANTPYGIGTWESIRYDQQLLDKIRNMTIDQLVLSIYKMWFYQGTDTLTETGKIDITPGKGRQVTDPKNITWLDVPGPGKDAMDAINHFQKDVDENSMITMPLMGSETSGKTAFEVAQAKESALKRLKIPLDNISEALEEDAYNTICLMRTLYSIPDVVRIADDDKIDEYLQAIGGNPELFERDDENNFFAKVYKQIEMGLNVDEQGNFVETKDSKFFHVMPEGLKWSGIINIKGQSILSPSKELDKAMDLEFANLLIPILQMPPELVMKVAVEMCKTYEKDPDDWLPDEWLGKGEEKQPLLTPGAGLQPATGATGGQEPSSPGNAVSPAGGAGISADKAVSSTKTEQRPTTQGGGVFNKLISRVSNAFKR